MGQVWEGTSPRWAGAPPHKGPRRLGFGEGVLPPNFGGKFPLSPPLAAAPHVDGILGPAPPGGLYKGGREGCCTLAPGASLSLP